jgi:hypothetical protein
VCVCVYSTSSANAATTPSTGNSTTLSFLNVRWLYPKRANLVSEPLFSVCSLVGLAECKLSGNDPPKLKEWLVGLVPRFHIHACPGPSKRSGGLVVLSQRDAGWHVTFSKRNGIEVAKADNNAESVYYVYHNGSVKKHHVQSLLKEIYSSSTTKRVVVMGDLNDENIGDEYAGFYSQQRMPTRFGSATATSLDVVLSNFALAAHVYPVPYSDHSAVWACVPPILRGGGNNETSSSPGAKTSTSTIRRRGKATGRTKHTEAYEQKKLNQKKARVKKDPRTPEQKVADRRDANTRRMAKERNAAKHDVQLLVPIDQTKTHEEWWHSLFDHRDESSNDRQPQVTVNHVFNASNDCHDLPKDIFTQ